MSSNNRPMLVLFMIGSLMLLATVSVYYLSKGTTSVETEVDGDYINVVYPSAAKKGTALTIKFKNENQTSYKVSLDVLDDDATWVTLKKYNSLVAYKNVTFSVDTDAVRSGTYSTIDFREKSYDFRVLMFQTATSDEALERLDFKIKIEASTSNKVVAWSLWIFMLAVPAVAVLMYMNKNKRRN